MVVECIVHMKQSIWSGGGIHGLYGTLHMEWWWNGWSIWHSPYGMVVECLVHMAQSIWNGGGMHSPYGTVHMEWWCNGWSIWHTPYGMVMKCKVHMAQSIWNNLERVKYCSKQQFMMCSMMK